MQRDDKYSSSRPRRGLTYLLHGIPVPQVGYVETRAVLYPAFSILSKNFYRNTVNEQQVQHRPWMDAGCWERDV